MAKREEKEAGGMVKYGVPPETLTREGTQGVEDEEEVRECVICGRPEGQCDHTRVKKSRP